MGMEADRAKQREIYEKYAPAIYRRCLRFFRSKEEAQDATSEVFMKLLDHWGEIENRESPLYWIHRTATNHCISQWRRKKFQADEGDDLEDNPRHSDPSLERILILRGIIRKIMFPWNQAVREIIIYTYWDGYTQEEIATLTGMAPSTIRKHLTHFRRTARKWMLDKLEGEYAI
jgi:RNA polymerase sigma factor (sigma-70 family)